LFHEYIAIQSSVATPYIENDWSREVLDVSQDQIDRFDEYRKAYQIKPEKVSKNRQPGELPDHYNRNGNFL
jgi:hypothetical protein